MKNRVCLALGLTLVGTALGCGLIGSKSGAVSKASRKYVGDAAFVDETGRKVNLSDYRGKVVLIDVWATWCPPCRMSLPEIAALQKKGGQDYAVLAVSVDRAGWNDVKPFLANNSGLGLQALIPDGREGLKTFGAISGIPTTLVVDRDVRLRERWSGFMPGKAEQALQAALQER